MDEESFWCIYTSKGANYTLLVVLNEQKSSLRNECAKEKTTLIIKTRGVLFWWKRTRPHFITLLWHHYIFILTSPYAAALLSGAHNREKTRNDLILRRWAIHRREYPAGVFMNSWWVLWGRERSREEAENRWFWFQLIHCCDFIHPLLFRRFRSLIKITARTLSPPPQTYTFRVLRLALYKH